MVNVENDQRTSLGSSDRHRMKGWWLPLKGLRKSKLHKHIVAPAEAEDPALCEEVRL